jgi:replicative DNA helicase Mcm
LPSDYTDEDLIARWEEFFESSGQRLKVIEVADLYPEQRSVFISYAELDMFDPDMADHILKHPLKSLTLGKQAMHKIVPPGREKAEVNLRITGLPKDSKIEIRRIRAEHLGKLIAVEGLVRKATEVRPKVTDALFQCMRCDHVIREPQEGMYFKEPLECYKDQGGCGKTASSTKFKLLSEESRYVDTQKIEIQENPEGLRGGAQPERLAGYIEDDLAGTISPGDRIILNGVIRSVQKGTVQKSTLFDINLDIMSVEFRTQEYDEVTISEEDEAEILEASKDPTLFKRIVASISPTIYGYESEKEAIALQLFGGVHKTLDDGTKIRGDIHVLLVGDPGVAKCVTGDAQVLLADCATRPIGDIVEEALENGPVEKVDDGVHAPLDLQVMAFSERGAIEPAKAVRVWKRTAPAKMLTIITKAGRKLCVTPTHPLFIQNGPWIQFRAAKLIYTGQHIAIATGAGQCGADETHGLKRGLDWDQVVKKEEIDAPEQFVYDIEVEGVHNFVTNGIISHNSQILRYMADMAPRGIYASGKSSSAAGLCVHPDTKIVVDGKEVKIGAFVEERMKSPQQTKPGVWSEACDGHEIGTIWGSPRPETRRLKAIWRLNTPSFLVELAAASGQRITLTPETRVKVRRFGMAGAFSRSVDLQIGDEVLVQDGEKTNWVALTGKKEVWSDLPPYVYDLTVDEAHTFLANGFVVHNTAAAVKDEFGEGRWTLEAGALVLADQGMCCIDELDKMEDQDRSAMHEAMESQSISVAKAGITARLQCRCSILGAANPKYGRFEESQFIADQIDLPPALMSRFDLIFAMTDKPQADKDARIAKHILSVHRRGEILRNVDLIGVDGGGAEKMLEETNFLEPSFSKEFLRKYVAYSKRIIPVLGDEAMKLIADNYLQIRKQGEGEGKSVPITARQLEAYVRLAEASARARLSRNVTLDDARRSVRIVEYYLGKIAGEDGKLDYDIIATGISKSQREQIVIIRELIRQNADREKGVGIEMLINLAQEDGVPEDRVRTLIKRLLDNGEVYQPSGGYYKLASEGGE